MNRNLILSLFQIAGLGCGIGAAVGMVYFGDRHDDAYTNHPGVGGAAIGCGVIAASCILSVVWIEVSKTKQ